MLRKRRASQSAAELADKEKKTRRNREKKVKKKMRDIMRKEEAREGIEVASADGGWERGGDEAEE